MNVRLGKRTQHFRTVTFDAASNRVVLIEQRLLPHEFKLVETHDYRETARAIRDIGVAGVGVGLAMQGVLSNLVAGLTIIFVKPFRVGDYIEINDVEGQVENIELFSTILVHPDLSRVLVPNRKIVGEIIHNYGKIRRADLSVGVAYSTDLNLALDAIRRVLEANPRVLKTPPPVIGTSTLADSSIVIAIKPWAALADFHPMQAEVNKAVVERLREAGIQIPFPQREVRVLPGSELKRAA